MLRSNIQCINSKFNELVWGSLLFGSDALTMNTESVSDQVTEQRCSLECEGSEFIKQITACDVGAVVWAQVPDFCDIM